MPVGDVGAVATLLNTIVGFFLDPDGYKKLTREAKLKTMQEALDVALKAGDVRTIDLIFVELRRVSAETN
jgi:hypothetical protein